MHVLLDPGLRAEPCDALPFAADKPNERATQRPETGRGVFFDHHIDLREPEGGRLTDRLVERFNMIRNKQRLRGRDTWRLRLRKLAANAMRGHFFRNPPSILYSRGAAADWCQDKPSWMKHGALANAIDPLMEAGLLDGLTGKKMPFGQKSWTSSYWATDDLIRIALDCGVEAASVVPDVPQEDLVQLFAPKPAPEYDLLKGVLVQPRKGKRIWFNSTAETREWADTLSAINAFYRQQRIGLDPAALNTWLAERNLDAAKEGPLYRLPEVFATDLYRVFNDGDQGNLQFNRGGRLFGGWWMSVPERARSAITINGQPTIELDYANCHPRMLYHERDLPGGGDLYALPEISAYEVAQELRPDTYRPYIKWLLQVLINGRGRPDSVEPPDDVAVPQDIAVKQVVSFIETMHQPIAEAFGTGDGLRLMRIESDIALEIVQTAAAEGWTVLSVHDSFIAAVDQRDRLQSMMIDSYVRRLGREPTIKGKE